MTQSSQRFCLRWNNHQSNLLSVFDQLLQDESFVDVTLAVEGQFLRAHKMVLSACSPYFQTLFVGHPDKHPIVILKDVPFADMRSLLDFMYRGEVSVDQDRLSAFLKVAESLRIKGLTEVNEDKCDTQSSLSSLISNPPSSSSAPPPPDLHRIQLSQPSHKRSSTPSSLNGATSPYSQKRKRGRPRKLSESSDGGDESPDRDSAVLDSDSKQLDSSYGNGPPDLLEVNMSDHPLNTSGALSDDGNESPERVISQEQEAEDFCFINNIKREIDEPNSPDNKNSSRENNVGMKSQISNHQSSERCPADNALSERRVQSLSRWCTISKDVSIIKLDKCSSSSPTTNKPGEPDYQTGSMDETGTVEKVEILPLLNDKKRSNDCGANSSSDCPDTVNNRLQFSPKVNNAAVINSTVAGNNYSAAAGMHFLFNQTQIDTNDGTATDADRPPIDMDKNIGDDNAATANEMGGGFFYKSSNSVVCKLCGEIMEWQELSGHSRVHQNAAPAVSALYKCRSCNVFFKTRRGCSGHIQSKQCSSKVNQGDCVGLATDCSTAERDVTGSLLPPLSYNTDGKSSKPFYKPVSDDNNSVREKEEKFVADIINRVKKECELQKSRIKKCILPLRTTAASPNSAFYPVLP